MECKCLTACLVAESLEHEEIGGYVVSVGRGQLCSAGIVEVVGRELIVLEAAPLPRK